jgi:hypothetical protein
MQADLRDPAARRRLYVTLALKRAHPGSGSGPETLWARTWRRPVFDLRTIVQLPFVVVGGVATRLYSPERMTDDLDVLILGETADEFSDALTRGGCRRLGRLAVGGSHWRMPDGVSLDVLESDEAWAREAVAQPQQGPDGLPVIALPYLVLMKMQASRGIDIGDLGRMLGAADDAALGETRRVIGRYLLDGVEDLESLIFLGKLEYEATARSDIPAPE